MQHRLAAKGNGHIVTTVDIQAGEPGRRDAHDFKLAPVQPDRFSNDARIAREISFPEVVADNGDGASLAAAAPVVVRHEHPPLHGRNAEDMEEIATHP